MNDELKTLSTNQAPGNLYEESLLDVQRYGKRLAENFESAYNDYENAEEKVHRGIERKGLTATLDRLSSNPGRFGKLKGYGYFGVADIERTWALDEVKELCRNLKAEDEARKKFLQYRRLQTLEDCQKPQRAKNPFSRD